MKVKIYKCLKSKNRMDSQITYCENIIYKLLN